MKKSTPTKIDVQLVERIEGQSPNETVNDVLGWALFEMKYQEKNAKKLGIDLKLYREATLYVSMTSKLLGYNNITFTEKIKEEMDYDEAIKNMYEEDI